MEMLMENTEPKILRKPPTAMPTTPEELLAFVSWPEKYEGETDEEHSARQKLCETLGKRYAEYMRQKVGALQTSSKPKVWIPGMR
jgi:hypothetical protein